MYPNGETAQPISARAVVVIYNVCKLPNQIFSYFPILPPSIPQISTKHPFVFGIFPPSINPLFNTHKTWSFVHFKGRGSATNIFVYVSQYIHTSKHPRGAHSLIINGKCKFLARACGQVECCVEFHPASLSEGWMGERHDYLPFPGTATLSEAIKQVVIAGCTLGCHIGVTNTDAASGHEAQVP